MKEKISVYILLLALIISNIYVFNTVLEKRKDINGISSGKDSDEEIGSKLDENREKEIKPKEKVSSEDKAQKNKGLSDDINGFEVITSGYVEGLEDFIFDYISDLYNYDSLEDKVELKKYYSEEKVNKDIEKEKKFKEEIEKESNDNEDPVVLNKDRYDEKSKLSKYDCLVYTIDKDSYLVEVILSRTARLIDKDNDIETSIDSDKAYIHRLKLVKKENQFKIDNEEVRYIEDIFTIKGILNQM